MSLFFATYFKGFHMFRMLPPCSIRRPSQIFYPFVVLGLGVSLLASVGCGPKLPGGKVKVTGTVMLDGSPLVCEGPGESFVNLSAENGGKGGAARFDRATGTFEMVVEPGNYTATVRATDGFEVEDEKRGTVTPAKSLIPEKYNSPDNSDAQVTVSPSGGDVSIKLSSE
jgi:hypothetical protein